VSNVLARTYINDDVVTVVPQDSLTKGERTSVQPMRRAVDEFATRCGASERQLSVIALGVTEAVSNAVAQPLRARWAAELLASQALNNS